MVPGTHPDHSEEVPSAVLCTRLSNALGIECLASLLIDVLLRSGFSRDIYELILEILLEDDHVLDIFLKDAEM